MGDRRQAGNQLVAQRNQPGSVFINMSTGLFQRCRHAHDAGDIFRAGALAALLRAALDQIGQTDPFAGIQHTAALGAVELMGGEGEHIDLLRDYVNVQVTCRLHGIGVKQDALTAAHGADLGNGLHGTDLVIGEHDGDKAGVGANRRFHLLGRNHTVFVHIQQRDCKTLLFQFL